MNISLSVGIALAKFGNSAGASGGKSLVPRLVLERGTSSDIGIIASL
jgi:hypothetical protein